MAGKTGIAWTGWTWNPLAGCSIVSPACTHCYAMGAAARIESMGKTPHYAGLTVMTKAGPVWAGKVVRATDRTLTQPLRWTKGRMIFVNSMSDLFHETVPDAWIDRIFAVMALSTIHTFQTLTKRSKRMREYFCGPWVGDGVAARIADASLEFVPYGKLPKDSAFSDVAVGPIMPNGEPEFGYRRFMKTFPLKNVWLGVTAEDQTRADERIPDLLACPAAVRFVSCEPLLGRIELRDWLAPRTNHEPNCSYVATRRRKPADGGQAPCDCYAGVVLDQVIVGGESGPKVRDMDADDARFLRDQCAATHVKFFMKQMSGTARADRENIPADLQIREFPT